MNARVLIVDDDAFMQACIHDAFMEPVLRCILKVEREILMVFQQENYATHDIHDHYFKASLSYPANVDALVRERVPPHLTVGSYIAL